MFIYERSKPALRSVIIIAILLSQQCWGNISAANYAAYFRSGTLCLRAIWRWQAAQTGVNQTGFVFRVFFVLFCFFFFNEENVAG